MAATLIIYDDPWSIIQHWTFLNISIYILSSGSVCQRVQQPLVTFRCVLCAWSMTSAACGFAHTGQFANHLSKQLVKTSKQKSHEHHEQPVFHPASSYVRVVPLPLAYKKATERGKEETWTNLRGKPCEKNHWSAGDLQSLPQETHGSVTDPASRSEHNATKAASGTGLNPLGIHVLSCVCFNVQTYPVLNLSHPANLKKI